MMELMTECDETSPGVNSFKIMLAQLKRNNLAVRAMFHKNNVYEALHCYKEVLSTSCTYQVTHMIQGRTAYVLLYSECFNVTYVLSIECKMHIIELLEISK